SFVKLLDVDAGFDSQRILTLDVNFGHGDTTRYPDLAKRAAFVKSSLDRLQAVPSIISVSAVGNLPLNGVGEEDAIFVDGPNVPVFERPIAGVKSVSPTYFQTL